MHNAISKNLSILFMYDDEDFGYAELNTKQNFNLIELRLWEGTCE